MSIELHLLAYSVLLLIILVFIQANVGVLSQGLVPMVGTRDALPPNKTFHARTLRIVSNHIEGLAMFAPLVLIAAIQNVHSDMTVLGARLFFYSRVVHAGAYLAGIPWVRTIAWFVGFVGTILIFLALFGIV